jgi:5-formyltetrahydrofolate cyclo-ligase
LTALPEFRAARTVCCYAALPREAQTEGILRACWRAGKTVGVPAYRATRGRYEFARVTSRTVWTRGRFGVPEPQTPRWMAGAAADLAVAPLVAFDARCGRVGYGGGHFDRLLRAIARARKRRGFAAGLAFECQAFDRVPTERWDVRLDAVVTEKRTIRRNSHNRPRAVARGGRRGPLTGRGKP